jgi:hypothetical protein
MSLLSYQLKSGHMHGGGVVLSCAWVAVRSLCEVFEPHVRGGGCLGTYLGAINFEHLSKDGHFSCRTHSIL